MAEPVMKPATPTSGSMGPGGISECVLSELEEMREALRRAGPLSGNEALRLLRQAFPDRPLAERAAALSQLAGTGT